MRDWEVAGKIGGEPARRPDARPNQDAPPNTNGPLLEDAIAQFLDDRRARHLTYATIKKYRTLLRTHLLPFCQRQQITRNELTLSYLRTFRNAWTFAPITHVKNLEYLRTFVRFCAADGWIVGNPTAGMKAPKVAQVPTLPYEDDDVTRLLDACGRWRYGQNQ